MTISNAGKVLSSVSTSEKIVELYNFIKSMETERENGPKDKDLVVSVNLHRQSQYSCTKMYDDDKYFILITVSVKLFKANIVIKKNNSVIYSRELTKRLDLISGNLDIVKHLSKKLPCLEACINVI